MRNERQRYFAELVASGIEPEEAALRAGYAKHTAAISAKSLMENADVLEHIAILKAREPNVIRLAPPPPPPKTAATNPLARLAASASVPTIDIPDSGGDPIKFLTCVMDNPAVDLAKRIDAASKLLPYKSEKMGTPGKKGARLRKAEDAMSSGPFVPQSPPPNNPSRH